MKISVCIATYNGAKYVREQLHSILPQLKADDEVIISDDSSLDDTLSIIKNFNDPRIKIIAGANLKSAIKNFENALRYSTGDIIFLSDQDDIWREDKIHQMTLALETSDLVMCDCSIIDEQNRVLHTSFFEINKSGPGVMKNLIKNSYSGNCMAFKRAVLHAALPFPGDIPMHDIWLGFVADTFFNTSFLKQPLTLFRRHATNASSGATFQSTNSFLRKVKNRFNIVKYFPALVVKMWKGSESSFSKRLY